MIKISTVCNEKNGDEKWMQGSIAVFICDNSENSENSENLGHVDTLDLSRHFFPYPEFQTSSAQQSLVLRRMLLAFISFNVTVI